MPGVLSQVVTVTRGSKFEASDVFPGSGSNTRHPLSVFPSLHRVLRDQFPGFISTMRVLRLPAAHPTALRFLRLAVPRLHSLGSLLGGRVRRRGLELVTRYLQPGYCRGNGRSSQVPVHNASFVTKCDKGGIMNRNLGDPVASSVISRPEIPGYQLQASAVHSSAEERTQRVQPRYHQAKETKRGGTGGRKSEHPHSTDEAGGTCPDGPGGGKEKPKGGA